MSVPGEYVFDNVCRVVLREHMEVSGLTRDLQYSTANLSLHKALII